MYIAEIVFPGTHLDIEDSDTAIEIEGMLYTLADLAAQAAISLTMFEASIMPIEVRRTERKRNKQLLQEVEDQLRAEAGELYYRDFEKFHLESQRPTRRCWRPWGRICSRRTSS